MLYKPICILRVVMCVNVFAFMPIIKTGIIIFFTYHRVENNPHVKKLLAKRRLIR